MLPRRKQYDVAGKVCPYKRHARILLCVQLYPYKNYPGKRPQTVCVRSVSRKSRDLGVQRGDGGDEVKVGVSEVGERECECECE